MVVWMRGVNYFGVAPRMMVTRKEVPSWESGVAIPTFVRLVRLLTSNLALRLSGANRHLWGILRPRTSELLPTRAPVGRRADLFRPLGTRTGYIDPL